MLQTKCILVGMLLCFLYGEAEGRLGIVGDVKTTGKLYQETTTKIVSWTAPKDNNGEDSSTFQYMVEYCKLNFLSTCKNTTLSSNTTAELSRLDRDQLYNFNVYVFDKNMMAGEVADGFFRTGSRDTCDNNHFACKNAQCVLKERRCDGISNCVDKSDETDEAGCAPPRSVPTFVGGKALSPRSIHITWDVIDVVKNDRITFYIVENINTSHIEEVKGPFLQPSIKTLSKTFYVLLANQNYQFRVRAKNLAGLGPWSDILTVRSGKAAHVGKVGSVMITPKLYEETHVMILSWTAPKDNNGEDSSTFQYMVEYCKLNFPNTCKNTTLSSNTTAELSRLDKDQLYNFNVYVFDKNLMAGEVTDGTFRTSLRDTCRNTTFTCGNAQCVPNFMKCDNIAQCADGTDETVLAGCPLPTITPTIKEGNSTQNSIRVTWNVVKVLSERIKRYKITNTNTTEVVIKNAPVNSPAVTTLSHTFTNLLGNKIYTFVLRTENPSGDSSPSSPLSVRTLKADRVGKVENVKTKGKLYKERTVIVMSWSPPINNNDEDTSKFTYTVEYCEINMANTCKNISGMNTSVELSNLKLSHLYNYYIHVFDTQMKAGISVDGTFRTGERDTCRVLFFACGNPQCVPNNYKCDGMSQCADGSDEKTAAGCLPPVNIPSFKNGETLSSKSIRVTWNVLKGISALEDRIKSYIVENMNTSTIEEVTAPIRQPSISTLSATFAGLLAKRMYHFRVQAKNPAGVGNWSAVLMVKTATAAVGLIGPVQNVSAFPIKYMETSAVNITWMPPADLKNNSLDFITYQVNICPANKACTVFTTKSNALYVEITGLKLLTPYDFLIYVYNENDVHDPNLVAKNIFHTRARDRCRDNQFMCVGSNQCVSRDRLCNGIFDCGDKSDESVGALCALPPAVENFFIKNITTSTVTLQFDSIKQQSHRVGTYKIQNLKTNEIMTIPQGLAAFSPPKVVTFTKLNKGTRYSFRAASVNPSGTSRWSVVSANTLGLSTGKVSNPSFDFKKYEETKTIVISWSPPTELNENKPGELTYFVKYCLLNLPNTCKTTPVSASQSVEITNLQKKTFYEFHIIVQNADNITGEVYDNAVTVPSRDSCKQQFFTCQQSNQCLPRNRTCDGILQCADGSDESKDASCKEPIFVPGDVQVIDYTSSTITFGFKQVHASDRVIRYEVEISAGDYKATEIINAQFGNAALRTITFRNLFSGITYSIKTRAVNMAGYGQWSSMVKATTTFVKPPPPAVNGRTESSISIQFKSIENVKEFEVELTDENGVVSYKTFKVNSSNTVVNVTIGDLDSGESYKMRVRAKTAAGPGPWSDTLQQTVAGDKEGTGLSNGEKAGIVVAIVLIVVLAMLLGVYFYRKKATGEGSIAKSDSSSNKSIENGMSNGFENSAYEMERK